MPDIGQIKGTNIKRGNSGLDPKIFDLNKELLDAMRIIARQEIDKAPRDITKNALVRSVNTNGTVNITIEGKEFNNIPNYTSGSISPNDTVKVTYPQNQASNMYVSGNKILNVYPVGSIYISLNQVNPTHLFGGVWEQIKDRFLISAGGNYDVNSTGGEATHKLTINEMPSHTHYWSIPIGGYSGWKTKSFTGYVLKWSSNTMYNTDHGTSIIHYLYNNLNGGNNNTGGDMAHNNIPPYLAVYMWKRIA